MTGGTVEGLPDTSTRVVVELLADRLDLLDAVVEMRWRQWGHAPEPTDWNWWCDATIREAGRDALPLTWVASDAGGALGAVGLGLFDIEERHDRSPWLLGTIVRGDRRRSGLGRLLLCTVEEWAGGHGHDQVWAANEGPALGFYRRCGWVVHETVERGARPGPAPPARRSGGVTGRSRRARRGRRSARRSARAGPGRRAGRRSARSTPPPPRPSARPARAGWCRSRSGDGGRRTR